MSVLVAISTLTAYVFSVVSYAFEVAGRPFSSPDNIEGTIHTIGFLGLLYRKHFTMPIIDVGQSFEFELQLVDSSDDGVGLERL
jgi:hypothetical protein